MTDKTKRPADAAASAGPRKIDRLGSKISPPNNPNASTSQAPCPADTAGESDCAYFRVRASATTRLRLPWPGEYPDDFLQRGGAVAIVRVIVTRDAAGRPMRGRRSLLFCEGGSA
jgi:hypothetical protein